MFHSSFCGSTLLSAVLQSPSTFLSLREPLILRRLSDAFADSTKPGRPPFDPELLRPCVAPLTGSYRRSQSVLIKPTNMSLNLIGGLLKNDPEAPALFVYDSLRSYLVSCLKKTAETQTKMRWLADRLVRSVYRLADYRQHFQRVEDPVLQAAAIVWHVQISEFRRLLLQLGSRAGSLRFQDLLEDPREWCTAAARFLRPDVAPEDWTRILNWDALNRHAKEPAMAYSLARREAEKTLIERHYRKRILATLAWSQPLLGSMRDNPLLPGNLGLPGRGPAAE